MGATHQLVPAPRFAAMRSWDCAWCDHEALQAPVFLAPLGGGTVVAAGSGCAALALGRPRQAARKVADEARQLQATADAHEAILAERRDRYAKALWQHEARLDGDDPAELASARTTYWQAGGADALGSFSDWLAHVAEHGTLRP